MPKGEKIYKLLKKLKTYEIVKRIYIQIKEILINSEFPLFVLKYV